MSQFFLRQIPRVRTRAGISTVAPSVPLYDRVAGRQGGVSPRSFLICLRFVVSDTSSGCGELKSSVGRYGVVSLEILSFFFADPCCCCAYAALLVPSATTSAAARAHIVGRRIIAATSRKRGGPAELFVLTVVG